MSSNTDGNAAVSGDRSADGRQTTANASSVTNTTLPPQGTTTQNGNSSNNDHQISSPSSSMDAALVAQVAALTGNGDDSPLSSPTSSFDQEMTEIEERIMSSPTASTVAGMIAAADAASTVISSPSSSLDVGMAAIETKPSSDANVAMSETSLDTEANDPKVAPGNSSLVSAAKENSSSPTSSEAAAALAASGLDSIDDRSQSAADIVHPMPSDPDAHLASGSSTTEIQQHAPSTQSLQPQDQSTSKASHQDPSTGSAFGHENDKLYGNISDSSLDSDEPISAWQMRRRRGRVAQAAARSKAVDASESEQQSRTPLDIETDVSLNNLSRLKRVQDSIKIITIRIVDDSDVRASNLSDFFSGPIYDGRHCQIITYTERKTSKRPKAHQYHVESVPIVKSFDQNGIEFIFDSITHTKSDADLIMADILKILDRIPVLISGGHQADKNLRMAIVAAATEHALPGHELRRPLVTYDASTESFKHEITFIQKGSLQPSKHSFSMRPIAMKDCDQPIPPIPSHYKFHGMRAQPGQGQAAADEAARKYPQPRTTAEKDLQDKAIHMIKYISIKLSGVIATADGIKKLRDTVQAPFRSRKIKRPDKWAFYAGKRMFDVQKRTDENIMVFKPSKFLVNDIKGILPNIVVHSLKKTAESQIADAIYQRWISSDGDVKKAWQAAAEEADGFNDENDEVGFMVLRCGCGPKEAKSNFHPCTRCTALTLCSELEFFNTTERLCEKCKVELDKLIKAGEISNYSPTEKYVRFHTLDGVISREYKDLGKSGDDPERIILKNELWEVLSKLLVDNIGIGVWKDEYSVGQTRPGQRSGLGSSSNPFQISVEAPFTLSSYNNEYAYHTPTNITMTAMYLNLGKMVYAPGVLTFISEWQHTQPKDQAAVQQFVNKMDVIHELAVKTPYIRKTRFSQRFSQSKLDKMHEEHQLTYILPSKNRPWKIKYKALHNKPIPSSTSITDKRWRPEDHTQIESVITEIELHFGKTVLRINSCPYPWTACGAPSEWTWKFAWKLFSMRLSRMTTACNAKFATIDCTTTLFLEAIWQSLSPDYPEFFALPMVIYDRHPLRFAIAKIVHGQAMRTRWTKTLPSSIQDRVDGLNNIVFETCTSNYAKNNFPNELYPAIQEDIKKVRVHQKWHKRSPLEGTRLTPEQTGQSKDDLEEFSTEADDKDLRMDFDDWEPLDSEDVDDGPKTSGQGSGGTANTGDAAPDAKSTKEGKEKNRGAAVSDKTITKSSRSAKSVNAILEDTDEAEADKAEEGDVADDEDDDIDDDRIDNYLDALRHNASNEIDPSIDANSPNFHTLLHARMVSHLRQRRDDTSINAVERQIVKLALERYGES